MKKRTSSLFHLSLLLYIFCTLSGCIEFYEDVSYLVDKARCNLRVGILSDMHLNPPHTDKAFAKALRYFKEREVDAVVFAGDVTKDGALAQWRGVKKVWEKVFPQGSAVVPIVVTGEKDTAQVYEQLTGEKYTTVFSQEVKGYVFIGANWKDVTGVDAWALKPLLAKVEKSKPFFYVQNLIPYGTCCPSEGRPDVYDGGKVPYMLSKFPNAVAICGRSHTSLTDEAAFWRGDFTCVNAGSFSSARMRGADGVAKPNVRHGLVVSVYDSSVVFERFDFGHEAKRRGQQSVYVEKLGPDWVLPLPATKPSARPETAAPQFWNDTRLMVFPSAEIVSVRFPPVLAKHTGVRAHAYEVVAKDSNGGELSSCVTWSPGFFASEEHETKPVTVNFPRAGLPKGKVRFEVTPLDAFGKRGRTISGEAQLW